MATPTEKIVHPMVSVPDAIRKVLEITAQALLQQEQPTDVMVVSTSAPASELLGCLLAEDVLMSEPGYPPYRASIMDGYAINIETTAASNSATDQTSEKEWTHQVSGRRHAGPSSRETPVSAIANNASLLPVTVYVTTGAHIPDSFDCVVPVELVKESTDQSNIAISQEATITEPGTWIRAVGCDIPAGSVVLPRGFCLDPVSLGLLRQSGQPSVQLVPPIRVGVLSTGNELLFPTKDATKTGGRGLLETGQIPDVNKPILMALLESFSKEHVPIRPIDLGMVRDDDPDSMTRTLQAALETCDVMLTTGGISMGETDIVEDVLVQRLGGALHFGRLNMKPGKPTTFVTVPVPHNKQRSCLAFALPGNPVSAAVCTHLVVRPALNMLAQFRGEDEIPALGQHNANTVQEMVNKTWVQPEILATLSHDIKLDMGRPEYHRVTVTAATSSLSRANHGLKFTVASTGVQRSSRLMSLRDAQGLLVLPRGSTQQPKALAGQVYPVLLLESQLYLPVRLQDSIHLSPVENGGNATKSRSPTLVMITQLSQDPSMYPFLSMTNISERVQNALSGSRSGAVKVVSCHEITGFPTSNMVAEFQKAKSGEAVDIWVMACSGSFSYSLEVSQILRTSVGKVADTVALQARRGTAEENGTAALFEPVVGYLAHPEEEEAKPGCMLIALPTNGLQGGLANVRGLLKHALNVARGKPHNHHH